MKLKQYDVLNCNVIPNVKYMADILAKNLTDALAQARAKYGHHCYVEEPDK